MKFPALITSGVMSFCFIIFFSVGLRAAPQDRDFEDLYDFFETQNLDEFSCLGDLSERIRRILFRHQFQEFETQEASLQAIRESWALRQYVHDQISQRYHLLKQEVGARKAVQILEACTPTLRLLKRLARFSEEIHVLRYWGEPKLKRVLEGPEPFLFVKSDFEQDWDRQDLAANLQTGDIIVTRSAASVSGVVSRVSDHPHHYAHLALVFRDEETGAVTTKEMLIETNLVKMSIDRWHERKLSRVGVFRFRPEYQEKVQEAFKNLKESIETVESARGRFVYDFRYDDGASVRRRQPANLETPLGLLSRYPRTHCSGLLEICVSPLIPGFPAFPSSLNEVDERFLDYLRMSTRELFMPSDLEIDPYVELIAEWRQPSRLRETQVMDVVVDSMLRWMREKNYQFMNNQIGDGLKASLVALARHFGIASDRISKDMPEYLLRAIINIDTVSNRLAERLQDVDRAYLHVQAESPKQYMGWMQLHEELEEIRQEDWEQFWDWFKDRYQRRPFFHGRFRPANIFDPSLHEGESK